MAKFLVIPSYENIGESVSLADEYGMGFEYNDFMTPDVLDDSANVGEMLEKYGEYPRYCTMHGDFFDVLVFSYDKMIREFPISVSARA